jgi:putative 2-oxoglutarate oxygenase
MAFSLTAAARLTGETHGNHRNSRFDMAQKVDGAFLDWDEGACSMVEIRLMGPQIGVQVTGIDVKTLDEEGFAPIYQAWLDYNILVVRDQQLEIRDFLRYSRRFGPVVPHPSKSTRHPEIPEITMLGINKFDANGKLRDEIYRRGAEGWHTDGAYNQAPFKATQLYALAVPSRGGNTLFANGYAAYDALPQRLKDRLDGVIGAFSYGGRRGKAKLLNPEDQDWTPVYHPIIRTHSETGRKSLYFDPGKIVGFVGIEERESDELISELKERMIAPNAEYHHIWRKGDIVIWDNRCSYHKAAGDYPPEEDRIHWRVSINDYGVEAQEAAE